MTQIVLDTATREKLRTASEYVEFVNETGQVVGVYCKMPPMPPPLSDEEYRRILADPRRYTTEEVLQHLRSL